MDYEVSVAMHKTIINDTSLREGEQSAGVALCEIDARIVAAQKRQYAIARMLLDAGADVNRHAPGDGSPLIIAAKRGDVAMVELFVAHGADVNIYVRGDETPLINAARNNHTSVARVLIEQGAESPA